MCKVFAKLKCMPAQFTSSPPPATVFPRPPPPICSSSLLILGSPHEGAQLKFEINKNHIVKRNTHLDDLNWCCLRCPNRQNAREGPSANEIHIPGKLAAENLRNCECAHTKILLFILTNTFSRGQTGPFWQRYF